MDAIAALAATTGVLCCCCCRCILISSCTLERRCWCCCRCFSAFALALNVVLIASCSAAIFFFLDHIALHVLRCCARHSISARVQPLGASMNIFPSVPFSNWTASAVLISLLPGSRSMCPSHLCLRSRMSATRSYVLVLGDASSWTLRPVIRLTQRALAPFMAAIVDSLRYHASLPYVKRLPTAHLYIFIFRLNAMPELNTALSWPILAIARDIRHSH